MDALETVHAFLAAAENREYDVSLPLLAEDVEYQNMPLPAVHGREAVRETLEALLSMCTRFEVVTHRELASGDTVMNERTDRFLLKGEWVDLPVAGVFVVRDGQITLWRDYFDLPTIMNKML
ncbi:MAG: limonene,2-epoxide hydrolase [Actinomycetota bacterium]|jgi:limonene-1,2-epoxide hydrolase|nr:limonene,2-epoxide hydrolase [Actinomycetota bacterium]